MAILFNNNFEFEIKNVNKDVGGNCILVQIKTIDRDILLVNIYGPNNDDPEFYSNLERNIRDMNVDEIIIGGDWNLVMDFDLDYDNYRHHNHEKAQERVLEVADNLDLVDIWKKINLEQRRYTWRRSNPVQQSRLDFFLTSDSLSSFVCDTDIIPG